MQWPGFRDWLFSLKTFAAAMLALYIAMSLGLERPYWAMASVYIASQPLSGATRSKAVYRLAGTLIGACAAVLMVPVLSNAPPLLSLVLALWVSGCLYLSLLDRTPRSYVSMLAGYTAAIIGFPSVNAPAAIFDTALTRVEEIAIGVCLASVVASVVFPRAVGPALVARIDAWFGNARRWSVDALRDRDTSVTELRRLAADGVEINLLASHLGYDATARETRRFALLRVRMIMLIPVLSSLADRMAAMRGRMPPAVQDLIARLADWVSIPSAAGAEAFLAEIDRLEAELGERADWDALLLGSLLVRLRDVVAILDDFDTLRWQMARPKAPDDTALRFAPEADTAPRWHRDHGMALLSAFACAVAVLASCAIWIATAWNEGFVAAEMVAVACSFFAAQDDPVPAIMQFLAWSVAGVAVDAILLFGVLPAVSNFATLALVLAPPFLIGGVLVSIPATANGGRAFTANAATLLALESAYAADFPGFTNSTIAFLLGLAMAAIITRLIRSVGAAVSARRLLRVIWLDLAATAERRGHHDRSRYAGLMMDRLGLIGPRLLEAETDGAPIDALTDIRVGFNILDLRRARHGVGAPVRRRIDAVLDALAVAYRGRGVNWPDDRVLGYVDGALRGVVEAGQETGRTDALLGLIGIRRGLFPDAPPAEYGA